MTSKPTLAVVAFPGNNCETETARAAEAAGFAATVLRWNQVDEVQGYEAYILPGGFSFEDRGRAGAIAAREPVFKALRAEAKRGKLILGICNGAQMIVESGLIPVGDDPLPYALADNVRRDKNDHVMGTGYYNTWCALAPERTDTAFSHGISGPIKVPIAHGEGRFTTTSLPARQALKTGLNVAFRYCDEAGHVDTNYPTTPNGAEYAVAMIVNAEGTVGAIMPHPERFPLEFEGLKILQAMRAWIEAGRSPAQVKVGVLSAQPQPVVQTLSFEANSEVLETALIITDNEAFSVNQAAVSLVGHDFKLTKATVYVLSGASQSEVEATGLLYNPNKETLQPFAAETNQILVELLEDDPALHLADQLSERLGKPVTVRRFKAWQFPADLNQTDLNKILTNGLLCNPHSGRLWTLNS